MGKFVPTAITYQDNGLVKDRDAFVLSDDAYQELENIYQWRGRLRRRVGYDLLGRLRRNLTAQALAAYSAAAPTNDYNVADILTGFRALEPEAGLAKSSVVITFDQGGANDTEFTDNGTAHFTRTAGAAYDLEPAIAITNISQAANAVIDMAGHNFLVGNKLFIEGVVGMTEINDTVVTVTAITAGVDVTVSLDTQLFTAYASGGTADGTYLNYDTGEINFTFLGGSTPAAGITVEAAYGYYPCLPVMGLPTRELDDINAEQTVAFDTIYAYNFNNTSSQFQELPAVTATTWTGANNDFFYTTNYWQTSDNAQYMWTTNFSGPSGDPIRIYDGIDWHDFAPTTSGADEMHQCRLLIPYKGRLVALNTFEGPNLAGSLQYPQRARWSQNGAPLSSVAAGVLPTATVEWLSDTKGRGGYVDAPTNEHIVSAEFIRDVLVVGFERSTWTLRYTGNEILPFVWERINKELGCESTFSLVAFDQGVLAVGDKSINSCNGNNVERIDQNIPDEVFNIHNNGGDGPLRVHGKRNFYEQIVYWTFPDASTDATFPDRVLVFNYENLTWSIFTDSFTTFGEYQRFNDITWADLGDQTWNEANFAWVTAKLQSQYPNIVAGNQHGFVLNLEQKVSNSPSLHITAVAGGAGAVRLTVPDHNLQSTISDPNEPTEYVKVNAIIGTGGLELNGRVFAVERIDSDNIDLFEKPRTAITGITVATEAVVTAPGHTFTKGQHFYIDAILVGMTQMTGLNGIVTSVSGNDITTNIDSSGFTAWSAGGEIQNLDADVVPAVVQARTYMGCGTLTRVMGFTAKSKKFNLLDKGEKTHLGYIDFLADVTQTGEVACSVYTDYNDSNPVNAVSDSFFNNVFSTEIEQFGGAGKSKEWHRFYCNVDSQFFEYDLSLTERQMFTPGITNSEVLIDAIIVWSDKAGRLID